MSLPGFFTVKWLMPSGFTHYYQTPIVTVVPMNENDAARDPGVMGQPKAVAFNDVSGMACSIDKGVVYILNDKGSTIDRVTLEQPVDMPEFVDLSGGDTPAGGVVIEGLPDAVKPSRRRGH